MVLRATQFHEFAGQASGRLRPGPLALVPVILIQPIAAGEVGAVLAEIVDKGPSRCVPDIAGPRRERQPDLARRRARHRGRRRLVVPLRLSGATDPAVRGGGPLPGPGAVLRGRSFDEWPRERGPARPVTMSTPGSKWPDTSQTAESAR